MNIITELRIIINKILLKYFINYKKSIFPILNKKYKFSITYILHIKENNWNSGFKWGSYHASNVKQYWEKEPVNHILKVDYSPKVINNIEIPYKINVLESKLAFGYGLYHADITFSPEKDCWFAFWLMSEDGIGEIDIFEMYSYKHSKISKVYDFLNLQYKLTNNIHYGDYKKDHKKLKEKLITKGYVWESYTFDLLWLPNKIEFYCNNYLIRSVTNKKVLDVLKCKKMNIIFNTGVSNNITSKEVTSYMMINSCYFYPFSKP